MPLHVCKTLLAIIMGTTLSACATTQPASPGMTASSSFAAGGSTRDLTPDEKKVVMDAVAPSLRDPAAAKYRWSKFSTDAPHGGNANYCAMVDAKSPYPAYSGWQSYVVAVGVTGGTITSAVIGAIAGGKDTAVVKKLCRRYGLDPANSV